MATTIVMPKMGYDMREGTVVRWYKREGEAVARGEVIADIETDKATVEFEAYTAGVLQRLVAVEGRPVPVGESIAVIGEPGEIAVAAMPRAAVETAAGPDAAGAADGVVVDGDTVAADDDGGVVDGETAVAAAVRVEGEVRASPLARRLARERGIELGLVVSSGPGGRVIERDVLGYAAAARAVVEDEVAVEVMPAAAEPVVAAAGVPEEMTVGETVVAAAAGAAAAELEESVGTVAADVAVGGAAAPPAVTVVDGMDEGMVAGDGVAEEAAPAVGVDAVTAAAVGVETAADADRVDEGTVAVEESVGVGTAGDVAGGEGTAVVGSPAGEMVVAAERVGAAVVEETTGEAAAVAGEGVEGRVGLSRMRQAIARVTGDSKRDAPHFYVTAEVDMGRAMALRREINDAVPGEQRVSVNDLVVRACAMGLGIHPKFNAFFRGDHLQYNAAVNIGIAITLESGLIVPGISHCEGKSLVEIAAASKDLIARAQRGALRQEEYGDTTFSVSNLGMFEVDSFAAIIFPPHAAVLAVGTVREQPVVRDGQLAVGQVMKATLSTDHRVADGAEAAQFLVEVKGLLENPVRLLL